MKILVRKMWKIYLITERILAFESDCDQLRKYKTIKRNWLYNVSRAYIQGDSRGNVSILEDDGIGHCGKNVRMNKCLVLKVAEIGLFESTNTKTV
jgi:hypothetical protein